MTVSNITTTDPYSSLDAQDNVKKAAQNWKALKNALQSGDLAAAQQAFTALQSDRPPKPDAQNSDQSTIDNDMKSLSSALQSGNLADAQKAFATLQSDIKSLQQTHKHRHHHHQDESATSTDSNVLSTGTNTDDQSTPGTLLNEIA